MQASGRRSSRVTGVSLAQSAIPNLAAEWAALKPRLAHHWPFELDVFQKQAVWHLERVRCSIRQYYVRSRCVVSTRVRVMLQLRPVKCTLLQAQGLVAIACTASG